MKHDLKLQPIFANFQKYLLAAAGLASGISFWLWKIDTPSFWASYLVNYLFWFSLTLGALPLVAIHHLAGGNWGFAIRRTLETSLSLFPVILLFLIPIFFNLKSIYLWADPLKTAVDEILKQKQAYLNPSAFIIRAAVYFAIWFILSRVFIEGSKKFDRVPSKRLGKNLQLLSGLSLLLYAFTCTFSSVDWAMSLEPHWYSTIYGVIFMIGEGLGAFCFALVVVLSLSRHHPFATIVNTERSHELGNLLLAFTMLWAYMGVSQLIIIWSGNLQEETPWYLKRFAGGWSYMGVFLALFHFAVPFILLLMRKIKRTPVSLLGVASLILAMRWVDLFWMIKPVFDSQLSFHISDFTVWLAMGSIWLYVFFVKFKNTDMILNHDPVLAGNSGSH